jgi:hypothetical protein
VQVTPPVFFSWMNPRIVPAAPLWPPNDADSWLV